jgi:Lrp/AsnC family leucine-responsive transcriptional regulator
MWTVKFQGEIDVAFYTWVESVPKFADKWFSFLEKYGEYIQKEEIYESVRMVHYPMKPLSDKRIDNEKVIGDGERVKYDDKDYKILEELTQNARVSIVDLSDRIELTPKAVISRIKKMEKVGIILGYNALIDINMLGYKFYKVDFYLNNFSKIKKMNDFARLNKNIVYRMRTVGGPGFEIEVMVRDSYELNDLIMKIRKEFPYVIKNYRVHEFEKTIKQVYLPGLD